MIQNELARLEAAGRPIRVGVSGAGWIGSGFVAQVAHVKGMQVNLLADTDVEAARQAFMAVGWPAEDIVETDKAVSRPARLRRHRG
jgi:predicted homoserine dehydrogenase-like protein